MNFNKYLEGKLVDPEKKIPGSKSKDFMRNIKKGEKFKVGDIAQDYGDWKWEIKKVSDSPEDVRSYDDSGALQEMIDTDNYGDGMKGIYFVGVVGVSSENKGSKVAYAVSIGSDTLGV